MLASGCKNCGGTVVWRAVQVDRRPQTPRGARVGWADPEWVRIPAALCAACVAAKQPPEQALWRAAGAAWAEADPAVRALAPAWVRRAGRA